MAAPGLCVETEVKDEEKPLGLKACVKGGGVRNPHTEQVFQLTWHKDIRPKGRTMCWDVSSLDDRAPVTLYSCHGMKGNQLWRYKPVSNFFLIF